MLIYCDIYFGIFFFPLCLRQLWGRKGKWNYQGNEPEKTENVLEHWTVSYRSLAHWPLKSPTDSSTVSKAAFDNMGLCYPKWHTGLFSVIHNLVPSALWWPPSGMGRSLQELKCSHHHPSFPAGHSPGFPPGPCLEVDWILCSPLTETHLLASLRWPPSSLSLLPPLNLLASLLIMSWSLLHPSWRMVENLCPGRTRAHRRNTSMRPRVRGTASAAHPQLGSLGVRGGMHSMYVKDQGSSIISHAEGMYCFLCHLKLYFG